MGYEAQLPAQLLSIFYDNL